MWTRPTALADGRAMDVWRRMIAAQGGDPDAPLPVARETQDVPAPATGVLTRLDAYAVGVAAWRLGAGRARKEDPVSAGGRRRAAGQAGDRVTRGRTAAAAARRRPAPASTRALAAWTAPSPSGLPPPTPPPLVLDRIAES